MPENTSEILPELSSGTYFNDSMGKLDSFLNSSPTLEEITNLNDDESLKAHVDHQKHKSSESAPYEFKNKRYIGIEFYELDLQNVKFTNCEFLECRFSKANMTGCIFSASQLVKTYIDKVLLDNAVFEGVRFSEAGSLSPLLVNNIKFIACIFESTDFVRCEFSHSTIELIRAVDSNFHATKFSFCGIDIDPANRCVFSESHFIQCLLYITNFEECNFSGSCFSHCTTKACGLSKSSTLDRIQSYGINKHYDLTIDNCSCRSSNFGNAIFENLRINNCDLSKTHFTNAKLPGAVIKHSALEGTKFSNADLKHADLRTSLFCHNTTLLNANVAECRVERFSLESLKNYGELTAGARMDMIIEDDVALLRSNYSGFLQWIHILSIGIFAYPYIWFLTKAWASSHTVITGEASITILKAFSMFVFNGGKSLDSGAFAFHWSFILFIYMLGYNTLRASLLWKTKALELKQIASELPVKFSLSESGWGNWYNLSKWGLVGNFAAVIVNTLYFMMRHIALSSI